MVHTLKNVILILLCLQSTMSLAQEKKTLTLTVPGSSEKNAVRNPFVADLLHLIAKNQNVNLDLVYHPDAILQGRALKELSKGGAIDLTWTMTTKAREEALRPIRIPIYRGLIGWRVFFIAAQAQPAFDAIETLEQLRSKLALQRFDWPDHAIFQANQLPVEGDINYFQMSKAIEQGLADYFPRSVLEIDREATYERNRALKIEKNILLKYPSAYYFFVNKKDEQLAQLIEQGFEKSIDNGSYAALFEKYYGKQLNALSLDKRRLFNLKNPTLSDEDFKKEEKYWYK